MDHKSHKVPTAKVASGTGPWSPIFNPEPFKGEWNLSRTFLSVAFVTVITTMLVLGAWMTSRINGIVTNDTAKAGAIFLQSTVQPLIQDIKPGKALTPDAKARLDMALGTPFYVENTELPKLRLAKIWWPDGRLFYSTSDDIDLEEEVEDEVHLAAAGQLSTGFELRTVAMPATPKSQEELLLEVYTPLYHTGTRKVLAIGEYYTSASNLTVLRDRLRNQTWVVVGATLATMVLALYTVTQHGSLTIERQRAELTNRINAAERLADENANLTSAAEASHRTAVATIDRYLGRIGADLHDGPIQLLGLHILSLDQPRWEPAGDGSDRPDPVQMAREVYGELRDIALGLSLPQIEKVTLEEALSSAVERHARITSTEVDTRFRNIALSTPAALKTVAYRIVQEALSNAFRHAGGTGQIVLAVRTGRRLRVIISDSGPGFPESVSAEAHFGLGLTGMLQRILAVNGTLRIRSVQGKGTCIIATLPLDQPA